MTAEQYREAIIRLLDELDERKLRLTYIFLLHLSGGPTSDRQK